MNQLQKTNNSALEIHALKEHILHEYGIGCEVRIVKDQPAILVKNHLSMLALVNKLRRDYAFTIYHPKGGNDYLIYVETNEKEVIS